MLNLAGKSTCRTGEQCGSPSVLIRLHAPPTSPGVVHALIWQPTPPVCVRTDRRQPGTRGPGVLAGPPQAGLLGGGDPGGRVARPGRPAAAGVPRDGARVRAQGGALLFPLHVAPLTLRHFPAHVAGRDSCLRTCQNLHVSLPICPCGVVASLLRMPQDAPAAPMALSPCRLQVHCSLQGVHACHTRSPTCECPFSWSRAVLTWLRWSRPWPPPRGKRARRCAGR